MDSAALPDEVSLRLADVGSEELEEMVERWLEALRPPDVARLLRNPHCTERIVRSLLAHRRLLTSYDVRRDLAQHPRTPTAQAMNLVKGLYWRDLVNVSQDVRIRPTVRRAADIQLVERLPGLAVGERMSIARKASATLLQKLRHDPEPRVLEAVMENPRCSEGVLMPLASDESARPAVLAALAKHRRWGIRYPIRVAVCRNPQTPVPVALPILPLLKKGDLRSVARAPRIAMAVRRRARLLLGELS